MTDQRDPREEAKVLAARAAKAVADARDAVRALLPGYPSSFDQTQAWCGARVDDLAAILEWPNADQALARVRQVVEDIESTATALARAARAISQRMRRIEGFTQESQRT